MYERLALVLTLVVTTLGAAFGLPASASLGASSDPVSRYQLEVKNVLIHDDRDGGLAGQGEMELTVQVIHCPDYLPSPCLYDGVPVGPQVTAKRSLKGNSGDTVTLNRVVPSPGDDIVGGDAPELGFYAIAGYYHLIRFDITEYDDVSNSELMGTALHSVETAKNGEGIGTFSVRSRTNQGTKQGDYTVTFEVRPVELPDVRPARIEVTDLPNSTKKHVCAVVQNIRDTPAGPFLVYILINGADSEGGKPVVASLGGGAVASACVDTTVPQTGEYQITTIVDSAHRVAEFNEANNVLTVNQKATPKTAAAEETPDRKQASSETTSTSASAQADLTVGSIKVNGQIPDGKDDCKPGKNAVSVVVKNGGTADADAFSVRLDVGGDAGDDLEQKVQGLDAGKEREVKFENVRLSKGEHTLTSTLDAKGAVDESNEENNEREVTARCKDAS